MGLTAIFCPVPAVCGKSSGGGTGPTNGDTIKGTDPTRILYSMPYIYDKFTWDHCEEEYGIGGDINLHLKSLYAASLSRRKQ